MEQAPDVTRVSRRRFILLSVGGAGLIGLTACLRRDPPPGGGPDAAKPAATQAAPAQAAATQAPAAAAKPAESQQGAGAQGPAAPPKPTEAPKPAAGTPKRGGTATLAVQNDWLTFDNTLNTAS